MATEQKCGTMVLLKEGLLPNAKPAAYPQLDARTIRKLCGSFDAP
jgi:hypothetical protein